MTKTELARRAVACKGWRWLPGMLTSCGVRVTEGGSDYLIGHRSGATREGGGWIEMDHAEPDLGDPATLGCIENRLLPDAWPGATISQATTMTGGGWLIIDSAGVNLFHTAGGKKADRLVAALEAAP